jgi:hypothetical protein
MATCADETCGHSAAPGYRRDMSNLSDAPMPNNTYTSQSPWWRYTPCMGNSVANVANRVKTRFSCDGLLNMANPKASRYAFIVVAFFVYHAFTTPSLRGFLGDAIASIVEDVPVVNALRLLLDDGSPIALRRVKTRPSRGHSNPWKNDFTKKN